MNAARVIGMASGLGLALGTVAYGHDFQPPPWERFQPYTTFQEWDFVEDNEEGPPDGSLPGNWFNQDPANDVPWFQLSGTAGWIAEDDGVWYGTGDGATLTFFCPNWIDQEPVKWVWIQISGAWNLPGAAASEPSVTGILGEKGTNPLYGGQRLDAGGDGTSTRVELWELFPNPDREWISISLPAGTYVSQVVIDTISFPAPGVTGALALAGLAASRRRR